MVIHQKDYPYNFSMSIKYHHLVVKEITHETPDTATFTFWHPVHQAISYQAGQFLTLCPEIGGKKVRRSYSMSSSPHTDASLAITIKRVVNGLVSNYLLDTLKVGDAIEVVEPMGKFVPKLNPLSTRDVVLFGAGSGITPLISIAKSVLTIEPNSRVFLYYGNRNQESIIFKKNLEELEEKFGNRLYITHILSQPQGVWVGEEGRISEGWAVRKLRASEVKIDTAEFFLCGPEGMTNDLRAGLKLLGVPADRTHFELFHSSPDIPEETDSQDTLQTQQVTIIYEGETHTVEVKPHQTILEAFLDQDIDLPYSCQAGMCTACIGKCTQGKVKMDEEDGLTEKEIQQGYILTCVAHPMSKNVVIEIE